MPVLVCVYPGLMMYYLLANHVGKAWRGRLVKWVEKSSIEKIRRLLEISERERHYQVLLT